MSHFERDYRLLHRQEDLVHFRAAVKETDLDIGIRKERFNDTIIPLVENIIIHFRGQIEDYIKTDPVFLKSHVPHEVLPGAPAIVVEMAGAARAAGVGPMAAVAGAIAQRVGRELQRISRDVIVENGGDIYLKTKRNRYIGIYAGKSSFSNRLAIEVHPGDTPMGICTSSGTLGHSLSYGCADAVVILSGSTALADAVATAAGNMVRSQDDLEKAVDFALSVPGITGAMAILNKKMAVRGRIRIIPT
ncbi:MAG: UPF0280 family protein [Bacillota bacterium]